MRVVVRKVRMNSFLQASGDPKVKNMKYYPGAKTMIMAPLDKRNGEFPLTGLTAEDETRLEKALGLNTGELARASRYWKEYAVTIPEDGLELDTSFAPDELKFKILSQSNLVATSLSQLNSMPDADFVMTNDDQEADAKNKKREAKKKAYAKLENMSHEDYCDYLRAKGNKGVETLSPQRIRDLVETDAEDNAKAFLAFLNDPHYKDKLFIAELVQHGLMRLQGTRYYEAGSNLTFGSNIEQVIDYLTSTKNQTVYITLSGALEDKKSGKRKVKDDEDED
jgi:hypothetical protein